MNGSWPLVLAALVGLLLGAGAMALLRRRADARATPPAPDGPVSADADAVLRALRSSVVLLDGDDGVLRASPSAFGLGLVRGGYLAPGAVLDMVARVRRSGDVEDRELTVPRGPLAGSGVLILQVRVTPLGEDRVLVAADDHTAARRLDQMRRDFVANVSHELKTPVGAIALLAETVHDAADEPAAVKHFASRMKREARRLTTLVQEIIDLSRLQEPDALVDSVLVDIDEVVTEAADRVRVEAEAQEIVLTVGGETGLRVYGDPDLLTTAVRNLLDNAIRHSRPATRVSVGVVRRGESVRIAVVDQGEGISKENQSRIFERFFRADPARARKTGGSGLGLSIVKHIAADHGGEVTVWSLPGKGATFTLIVPRAAEEDDGADAPPTAGTTEPAPATPEDEGDAR